MHLQLTLGLPAHNGRWRIKLPDTHTYTVVIGRSAPVKREYYDNYHFLHNCQILRREQFTQSKGNLIR